MLFLIAALIVLFNSFRKSCPSALLNNEEKRSENWFVAGAVLLLLLVPPEMGLGWLGLLKLKLNPLLGKTNWAWIATERMARASAAMMSFIAFGGYVGIEWGRVFGRVRRE